MRFNIFFLSIIVFSFFSCKNNNQIEETFQTILLDYECKKIYIVNDHFYIDLKSNLQTYATLDKEVKFVTENNKIKISLDSIDYGWHILEIVLGNDETISFHVNKILDLPNVLIPSTIIYSGWYARNNIYNKKYKKYIQKNYSIQDTYFGSFRDDWSNVLFDDRGIPVLLYQDKGIQYNPTLIAQYALTFYNLEEMTPSEKEKFIFLADYICNNLINIDGSIPYNFDYKMHGIDLYSPWYSGMAQGQILSVLARAYNITNDSKYIYIGESVLNFMISYCKKTLSQFTKLHPDFKKYENYVIYEEYVAEENSYVLNGNIFGLIGLHDWFECSGNQEALKAFNLGCKSIEFLLPYYDYHGSSSYDLIHFINEEDIDLKNSYMHDYHIALLDALFCYTNNNIFKQYRDLFINYYEKTLSF